MASVGQYNTGPEIHLRSALHRIGIRYRVNDKRLPGSPDLVFPRFKAVVFVHGCFWHAHARCRYATKPSSRVDFWKNKFKDNRKRDRKNYVALNEKGWRVLVVWECAIKSKGTVDLNDLANEIGTWLKSGFNRGNSLVLRSNSLWSVSNDPATNLLFTAPRLASRDPRAAKKSLQ
jgi:DNA mismatch endonuclease (patch repair protein)